MHGLVQSTGACSLDKNFHHYGGDRSSRQPGTLAQSPTHPRLDALAGSGHRRTPQLQLPLSIPSPLFSSPERSLFFCSPHPHPVMGLAFSATSSDSHTAWHYHTCTKWTALLQSLVVGFLDLPKRWKPGTLFTGLQLVRTSICARLEGWMTIH